MTTTPPEPKPDPQPEAKQSKWVLVMWQMKCRDPGSLPPREDLMKLVGCDDAVMDERWMQGMLDVLNYDWNVACTTTRFDDDYGLSFLFQIPASRWKPDFKVTLTEYKTGRFYCGELRVKELDRPITGQLHFGL